jgi:hypothetical protein
MAWNRLSASHAIVSSTVESLVILYTQRTTELSANTVLDEYLYPVDNHRFLTLLQLDSIMQCTRVNFYYAMI